MESKQINTEEPCENCNNEVKEINEDVFDTKIPSDRYISDVIKVKIVPEKKGGFLKYTEYEISSENYKTSVYHRYTDFFNLYEYFLKAYEFRMIPRLPPKLLMLSALLEERRSGLQRWLTLISQHPILSTDKIFKFFLVHNSNEFHQDFCSELKNECSMSLSIMRFEKIINLENILTKREQIRKIINHLCAIKNIISNQIKKRNNQRKDYGDLASSLCSISKNIKDDSLKEISKNFLEISKITENANGNLLDERLELLNEVLIAFNDLCDRIIYRKQTSFSNEKSSTNSFNNIWFKNIIRKQNTNNEEDNERMRVQQNHLSFGCYCVIEEFKLVEKYLKLLPSIVLQFTYNESKTYSDISHILHNIIDTESDKLNT
ncbi:hypothetical protein PVAND_011711 [Polypedilum vanderplanki]|uniref:PX domain-containing protein n=1 Tax=Polypedilum vanderplanki TaxID=319348 RepID=A0A9J6CJG0_POLVA|nr:hypothetical protein PVAND_011711 [Polypedilum vanderplanki]